MGFEGTAAPWGTERRSAPHYALLDIYQDAWAQASTRVKREAVVLLVDSELR